MTCPGCPYTTDSRASLSAHLARVHRDRYVELALEAYTDRRGPDDCWPWTGTRSRKGYGVLVIDRRQHIVPRLLLGLEVGDARLACHGCDNPPCVNPAHLHVGTHASNQAEKAERGRSLVEDNGGGGQLTWDDVYDMRRSGDSVADLAERYGVSDTMVRRVLRGSAWREERRP